MTYRDRRLRRAERLRAWAEKRHQNAAAALQQNEKYRGDHAFNTQPGHIPERARVIARTDRAFESIRKADHIASRAEEIERQADHSIYSDDPDAIEQLRERIAGLEARRDRMKVINKSIRRGPGWEARIAPPLSEAERADLASLARAWAGVYKPGYPPYALQNLAGNLTRQRQRLARLLAADGARTESAEAAPDAPRAPEAEPAPTLADFAAVLNVEPPPLADCPFSLSPPPGGPDAAQPSLFIGPPADATTTTAECPICEGTATQAIQLAGGDHRFEPCDVCHGTGRMKADQAAALARRIREDNEEAIRRLDAKREADEDPIDDETGQRLL